MVPMVDGNMNMQHWWNDTSGMETKYFHYPKYFGLVPPHIQ
jgi:hypothetical protein